MHINPANHPIGAPKKDILDAPGRPENDIANAPRAPLRDVRWSKSSADGFLGALKSTRINIQSTQINDKSTRINSNQIKATHRNFRCS